MHPYLLNPLWSVSVVFHRIWKGVLKAHAKSFLDV